MFVQEFCVFPNFIEDVGKTEFLTDIDFKPLLLILA